MEQFIRSTSHFAERGCVRSSSRSSSIAGVSYYSFGRSIWD